MSSPDRDCKTEFAHKHGDPPIGVSVHTTKALADRNGRASEHSVVQSLSHALDHAEFSYEIDFGFPIKDPDLPEEEQLGKWEVYKWWRSFVNNDPPFKPRKDSNLLLTDRDGGGLGAIGGWVAITPGRNIAPYTQHQWSGETGNSKIRNLFATLHEFSHNLGMKHDPHWGNGWNENGKWHRTITVSSNGTYNECGEWIEKRENGSEVRYLVFHDCATDHMKIKNEDADDVEGPVTDEPALPDPPHEPPELPDPPTENPGQPP